MLYKRGLLHFNETLQTGRGLELTNTWLGGFNIRKFLLAPTRSGFTSQKTMVTC
jgi:hypothetical protein